MLELADGGELFERIGQRGAYSEQDAARVVRQVGCPHHERALPTDRPADLPTCRWVRRWRTCTR